MKREAKGKGLDEGRPVKPHRGSVPTLAGRAGPRSRYHPEQLGGLCSGLYPLGQDHSPFYQRRVGDIFMSVNQPHQPQGRAICVATGPW